MKENKYAKKVTIRVTHDQYDFLEKLDNASEWMRNAIDAKMFEETTDVLAVVRRIEFLEGRKREIYNFPEYQLAKYVGDYYEFTRFFKDLIEKQPEEVEKPPIEFGYDNLEERIIWCKVYGLDLSQYSREAKRLITQADLQDFMNENNLKITSLLGNEWGRDVMLKFLEKFKEKIVYMKKVYGKYTTKIAEIQTEIDELKSKL